MSKKWPRETDEGSQDPTRRDFVSLLKCLQNPSGVQPVRLHDTQLGTTVKLDADTQLPLSTFKVKHVRTLPSCSNNIFMTAYGRKYVWNMGFVGKRRTWVGTGQVYLGPQVSSWKEKVEKTTLLHAPVVVKKWQSVLYSGPPWKKTWSALWVPLQWRECDKVPL